jgi:tetratricopeptide (TPR) repeat protein
MAALMVGIFVLLDGAIHLQNLLTRSKPDYTAPELYSRAVDITKSGDYVQAESYLEAALTKEEDPKYRNQLAVVEYRLKKYQDAIVQYQKLISANTDVAFAQNGIGNAYRDWADQESDQSSSNAVMRLAKAETAYKASIKADKMFLAAYSNLAILLNEHGRKAEAMAILDEGISVTGSTELAQTRAALGK